MTNYKIELTHAQALATAEMLVELVPQSHVARPQYVDPETNRPVCLVGWVLSLSGFNPPQEWWDAPRDVSTTKHRNVHIRFLAAEIFSNEDLLRDELLLRLQRGNDTHVDRRWVSILKRAKAGMTRQAERLAANLASASRVSAVD